MNNSIHPKWFRDRGYIHLVGRTSIARNANSLMAKIKNRDFVSSYAFHPLIHTTIVERRYKMNGDPPRRAHSHDKNGQTALSRKMRPLHYASHMDALIFGYYAELLQQKYEDLLEKTPKLSECITAYRKIPDGSTGKNKGTSHFAGEVFDELKKRAAKSDCVILKFDITSFFSSIDHKLLMRAWASLIEETPLPKDHYNVFKAATRLHYVLLDDLRVYKSKHGRRPGFDEKHLANIRKSGIEALIGNAQDLRNAIRGKDIRVYKSPFVKNASPNDNSKKIAMGIPQGLPISATLANLYLLEFDLAVLQNLVLPRGCYYRRYSDDLVIICDTHEADYVSNFIVKSIEEREVEISPGKTEKFLFKKLPGKALKERITSVKCVGEKQFIGTPFTYLGFEFYGYQTLIKSANISKFYRRMIYAVKKKSKRAIQIASLTPGEEPILYRNQLFRLYASQNLNRTKIRTNSKKLVPNKFGIYLYKTKPKEKALRSNYFSYARRASRIIGDPKIALQTRRHEFIFNQAVHRHLNKRRV